MMNKGKMDLFDKKRFNPFEDDDEYDSEFYDDEYKGMDEFEKQVSIMEDAEYKLKFIKSCLDDAIYSMSEDYCPANKVAFMKAFNFNNVLSDEKYSGFHRVIKMAINYSDEHKDSTPVILIENDTSSSLIYIAIEIHYNSSILGKYIDYIPVGVVSINDM